MMYAAAAFWATDPWRTTVTHDQMRAIRRFAVEKSASATSDESFPAESSTASVQAVLPVAALDKDVSQMCGQAEVGQRADY